MHNSTLKGFYNYFINNNTKWVFSTLKTWYVLSEFFRSFANDNLPNDLPFFQEEEEYFPNFHFVVQWMN